MGIGRSGLWCGRLIALSVAGALALATWSDARVSLGRAEAASAPVGAEKRGLEWAPVIKEIGQRHGVCAAAIAAVVEHESGFKPGAKNPNSTATGMMQLLKGTAEGLGLKVTPTDERLDGRKNIDAGTRYLKSNLEAGRGSLRLALAGYYLGPLFVQAFGGVPPNALSYTNVACARMARYEELYGVTCPASYCAALPGDGQAPIVVGKDLPVRVEVGSRSVEFANGDVVRALFQDRLITILYRYDDGTYAYQIVEGQSPNLYVKVPMSALDEWREQGRLAEIGFSPEVPNVTPASVESRTTVFALLNEAAFSRPGVTVREPRRVETKGSTKAPALVRKVSVLRDAYGGELVAHDLVERAGQQVIASWARLGVANPFVYSLVRTRQVHDESASFTTGCQKRDLGLLGLSVVVSHTDPERQGRGAMQALLADAQAALKAELGTEADLLRVEVGRLYVLIELRDDTDVGRREIEKRRKILERVGALTSGGSGLPAPSEVRTVR